MRENLPIIKYNIYNETQDFIESPFGMLDDFSVSSDGKSLIGADFFSGNILSYELDLDFHN